MSLTTTASEFNDEQTEINKALLAGQLIKNGFKLNIEKFHSGAHIEARRTFKFCLSLVQQKNYEKNEIEIFCTNEKTINNIKYNIWNNENTSFVKPQFITSILDQNKDQFNETDPIEILVIMKQKDFKRGWSSIAQKALTGVNDLHILTKVSNSYSNNIRNYIYPEFNFLIEVPNL